MNKKYSIHWKSKVNGQVGRGTKLFDYDEALELAGELNVDYPEIEHEIMEVPNTKTERGNLRHERTAEDQSKEPSLQGTLND
jgi:hypothetical protein